jgi:hypothetical protein
VQICKFWKNLADSLTLLCKYDSAVTFDVIFARLWLPLKGISIEKTYIGHLSYTIPVTFTHKKWGLNRDQWLRCDKNRRLQIRFSRRILIHIEKGFNPCPRGLGGVVWWKKTRGRKSRVRVPLRALLNIHS